MNRSFNLEVLRIRTILIATLISPGLVMAEEAAEISLDLTGSGVGIAALVIFFVAYLLAMTEEYTDLRKSKPVMIAAGITWAMIGTV